jgi:hypothetical protein
MSQEHVNVLRKVKRRFAEQRTWKIADSYVEWAYHSYDSEHRSTSPFICDQIHDIIEGQHMRDHPLATEMCMRINKLINGHFSVVHWLAEQGVLLDLDRDRANRTPEMQDYRLSWLDQLIVDAEAW